MKNIARWGCSVFYIFLLAHIACEPSSFEIALFHSFNQKNMQEVQYLLKVEDALSLKIDEEQPLLKGVDVEVSQSVAKPLAFFLYSLLSSSTEGERRYNTKELAKEELNAKKSFTFRFAYDERSKFSPDATIKLMPCFLNEKMHPIVLKFSQTKEGMGEDKKLNIKIKPIFHDIGGIKFSFVYPALPEGVNALQPNEMKEAQNISVRVDDKYIKDWAKPFFTKVGQHKIQVESPLYRSEVITCVIEKGKTEVLEILLKPLQPMLAIEAPSAVLAYLDDVLIKLPFYSSVQKGEHIVKFVLEDYEIIRSINIEDGKTYNLNLSLDLKVIEKDNFF